MRRPEINGVDGYAAKRNELARRTYSLDTEQLHKYMSKAKIIYRILIFNISLELQKVAIDIKQ